MTERAERCKRPQERDFALSFFSGELCDCCERQTGGIKKELLNEVLTKDEDLPKCRAICSLTASYNHLELENDYQDDTILNTNGSISALREVLTCSPRVHY